MDDFAPATDIGKVLQAGRLAKVSLYRRLLGKVASGAPLSAYEMRTVRELGVELEAMAEGEKTIETAPPAFDRVTRQDLALHIFRVSPQTVSKWVLKEGMPRNDDGTFSIGECVEWAIERFEESSGGKGEPDEAKQWLTEFRKERALKARMEREALQGDLFPRGEVMAAWCNRYAHLKRYLLLWSKRLPGRIAGMDERGMMQVFDDEVRFLLSLLSRPGKFCELPPEALSEEGA